MFRLTRSSAVPENVIEPVSPTFGIVSTKGAPFAVKEPVMTFWAVPARFGRRLRAGALRLGVRGFVAGASCESTTRAAPLPTPMNDAAKTKTATRRQSDRNDPLSRPKRTDQPPSPHLEEPRHRGSDRSKMKDC